MSLVKWKIILLLFLCLVTGKQISMADTKFEKKPDLFNYDAVAPENRNRGFSSLVPGGDLDAAPAVNPAPAKNPWSPTDKVLLAAYEALNAGDWAQTRQIQNRRDLQEMPAPYGSSQVIGTKPSTASDTMLMGAQAVGVPLVANQLSSGWRKALLGALLAGKLFTVNNNRKHGLDVARF